MSPGKTVDVNATRLAGVYRQMLDMVFLKKISRQTLIEIVATLKSVAQELERLIADPQQGTAE